MDIKRIFSDRLNEIMEYSSISYAELSRELGISKARMSMYKHGKALPSLEHFLKMCEILEVSCDYMLGKKEI